MQGGLPVNLAGEGFRQTVLAATGAAVAVLLTVPVLGAAMFVFDELRLDGVLPSVLLFVAVPALVVSLFAYGLGRRLGGPTWARASAVAVLAVALAITWTIVEGLTFCGPC